MNLDRAGHRRPYEKWERISVVAVVVVAILVVTLNHVQSPGKKHSTTSTTTSIASRTTASTPQPTGAIPNSPPESANFVPVSTADTDFAGKTLDTSVWDAYNGAGNQNVGLRRPSAISINNGLKITGQGNVSGGTAQKFGQTYGRWVVRAQMEKGDGYGPAILLWPDSEKWPQDVEIDMVELPQGDRSQAAMTVHYGKSNLQQAQTAFGDFSQWHTYAVDWLPGGITFYIDGVEKFKITDPAAIPTNSHHLAIQNDIGACGSYIGCRDTSTPPTVSLHVSSVRVYAYTGPTE